MCVVHVINVAHSLKGARTKSTPETMTCICIKQRGAPCGLPFEVMLNFQRLCKHFKQDQRIFTWLFSHTGFNYNVSGIFQFAKYINPHVAETGIYRNY